MKVFTLLFVVLALAACGEATGPQLNDQPYFSGGDGEAICDSTKSQDKDQDKEGWAWNMKPDSAGVGK